jgi:hypothetical protein
MLDSVKFLKECLDNHSGIVDIVLGRPEPLVKQGTELMQGLLSEVFGLPGPALEATLEEAEEERMEEVEEEVNEEVEEELELASESEAEFLWESVHPREFIDIEAELASEQESTSDLDSELTEFTELPELETAAPYLPNLPAWMHPGTAVDDVDGSSEQSEDSSVLATKSKTPSRQEYRDIRLQQEEHERILRQKKRQRAREERRALYTRFGLTVGNAEEDQDETHEDERRSSKRQKRDVSPLEVSSESQPQ